MKRIATQYPGVYCKILKSRSTGKDEKAFYIEYRRAGKKYHEKVGTEATGMTIAKANNIRIQKIAGKILTNSEKRNLDKSSKLAKKGRWTINRLWESYKSNKVNFKGLSRDESRFLTHIKPAFGDKEPREIIALDVDRLKRDLLKKKRLKPQSVKNILELLRRISNYGMKKNLCPGLSFSIEMPKCDNQINESLSNEQIKSLLAVIDANPLNIEALIMKVILYTGRRTGEICKLTWKDVDLERRSLTLRDTKTNQNETIPFSDEVKSIFEKMPKLHDKFVFPNKDGSARKRCDRDSRAMLDKAGIDKSFRPTYCLRHTFASIAASNGIEYHVLKALTGHKRASSDITARYAHINPDTLLKAVNRVADVINNIRKAENPAKRVRIENNL